MSTNKTNLFEQVTGYYKGTKSAIEGLSGVLEGALGYATDTDEFGTYNGAAWTWGVGIPSETDPVFLASEAANFETGDKSKLDGIEPGAEVNNISDANATDLTDSGETTLHTHSFATLGVREVLINHRTYYIDPSGHDGASGLNPGTDPVDGAHLTPLHTLAVAGALDSSVYNVTTQFADGTYVTGDLVLPNLLGSGDLYFQGNASTPDNVVIDGGIVKIAPGTAYNVDGMKFNNSTSGSPVGISAKFGALIRCSKVNLGSGYTFPLVCDYNGILRFVGSANVISGGASLYFILLDNHGIIDISGTITLTGTPGFLAFVVAVGGSYLRVDSSITTFSGSATGIKYVSDASIINTFGGGINFLPGDSAGWTTNGGVYL